MTLFSLVPGSEICSWETTKMFSTMAPWRKTVIFGTWVDEFWTIATRGTAPLGFPGFVWEKLQWMKEILHQLIGGLSHCFVWVSTCFNHSGWCRISLAHPQYVWEIPSHCYLLGTPNGTLRSAIRGRRSRQHCWGVTPVTPKVSSLKVRIMLGLPVWARRSKIFWNRGNFLWLQKRPSRNSLLPTFLGELLELIIWLDDFRWFFGRDGSFSSLFSINWQCFRSPMISCSTGPWGCNGTDLDNFQRGVDVGNCFQVAINKRSKKNTYGLAYSTGRSHRIGWWEHWNRKAQYIWSMDWFLGENLNRKPWVFPWRSWCFPVKFPTNPLIWS